MSEIATNVLDHFVHLVPPGSLDQASEQFRALGFTVVPGGVHAGGHSMNALVIFADAVYIEIIAFTGPKYPSHRWANKAPGWIDYAFMGNGSLENRVSTVINCRAEHEGSSVRYLAEEKGGRTRQDGVRLDWLISAPQGQDPLPFFCGDITPRNLRVPSSHVQHPSGAVGIAHIRLLANASSLRALVTQLTTVIGNRPVQSSETKLVWDLQTPNSQVVKLILDVPSSDEETQFLEEHGAAIYEVGITAQNREGARKTPYGRLTFVDAGR